MVTKHNPNGIFNQDCSVLAKILMVTKPNKYIYVKKDSSVLAKILMVTKLVPV